MRVPRSVRTPQLAGVTLIEVLIAIVILAVGILGVAQLQTASLRNTAVAQALNETTRAVRGELEWQRTTAVAPVDDDTCATVPDDFESCTVDVVACAYYVVDEDAGTTAFGCEPDVTVTTPSTYRVTVTAVGPRGQSLALSAMWTGNFVDGAAGAVEGSAVTGD